MILAMVLAMRLMRLGMVVDDLAMRLMRVLR